MLANRESSNLAARWKIDRPCFSTSLCAESSSEETHLRCASSSSFLSSFDSSKKLFNNCLYLTMFSKTRIPLSSVLLNASSSRWMTSWTCFLLGADFGEDVAHRVGEHVHEFVEERFVEAERAAVAHGAAQDAAQDVVAVVVAGLDAVGDGEAQRADVVGDDAEGDVGLLLFGVGRCAAGCRAAWCRISCRSASPSRRRSGGRCRSRSWRSWRWRNR